MKAPSNQKPPRVRVLPREKEKEIPAQITPLGEVGEEKVRRQRMRGRLSLRQKFPASFAKKNLGTMSRSAGLRKRLKEKGALKIAAKTLMWERQVSATKNPLLRQP